MPPYKILGVYKPQRWRASIIGPDLVELTRQHGLVPHVDAAHGPQETSSWCSIADHAEVRIWTSSKPSGTDWHQDGDTTPGASMDCGLVLWSSVTPTQFRVNDVVYTPSPFDVVYVRNLACQHRRPPEAVGKRWIFRQRVK